MRDRHGQVGRFGDHRSVGGPVFDDGLCADALELFVADARDDEPTGRPGILHAAGRVHHGGHAALHVLRAASVEAAVALDAIERRLHAFDADGVDMPAEHQCRTRLPAFEHAHGIRAARRDFPHGGVDAGARHPRGTEFGDPGFAGRELLK